MAVDLLIIYFYLDIKKNAIVAYGKAAILKSNVTQNVGWWIKCRTFWLWGNSANHCTLPLACMLASCSDGGPV